jgi:hypothetical protein
MIQEYRFPFTTRQRIFLSIHGIRDMGILLINFLPKKIKIKTLNKLDVIFSIVQQEPR